METGDDAPNTCSASKSWSVNSYAGRATRIDDEQTFVLCRSEQRIAKDRAIRDKYEQRFLADIDKLSRRIANKKPEKINQGISVVRRPIYSARRRAAAGFPVPPALPRAAVRGAA
jgi:hypothetical protein